MRITTIFFTLLVALVASGCSETSCLTCLNEEQPTWLILGDDVIPTTTVGLCTVVEVLDDDRLEGGQFGEGLILVAVDSLQNGRAQIVDARKGIVKYCATEVGPSSFTYTARAQSSPNGPTATATARGQNTASVDACASNSAPSVSFTADVQADGKTVRFTVEVTDPDGTDGVTYVINRGDGTTSSSSGDYEYSANGDYTAKVTVTDPCGATATRSVTVTITGHQTAQNARPVISLEFSGNVLQLPYSGTLATCSQELADGSTISLDVKYRHQNGGLLTPNEVRSITEQTDVTVECVSTADDQSANPVTFTVVPPTYTGPVANEDRMPKGAEMGIVEVLDDDHNSPTDSGNDRLRVCGVDQFQNVLADVGNMVVVNGVYEFQSVDLDRGETGTVVQFRRNGSGRMSLRYKVCRDDGATATAYVREDL